MHFSLKVRYSLADNQNRGSNFYGQQRKVLAPVLGHNDKLATDTMSIQKNCGEDNICVPDLSVEASTSGAFQYGGQDKMEITAEIINNGEDAFNAMLYLQLPREINWNSASSSTPGVSVLCSAPDAMNNRTLECDVGNPFPANTRVSKLSQLPSIFDQCVKKDLQGVPTSLVHKGKTLEITKDAKDKKKSLNFEHPSI